ncbi:GntR family transcriptional regulator [Vibrio mediterranei]|jgi:GntR family uxuAB operon transcriptional repressor|uniref:FCD domain-containing protein n=1 Tax=Vibrio mediterranei TaxID=689 RepID=UPI000D182BC0|nr:FCD domain-containing protein [Vibrio mediterranei]PTC06681.1 GntR family transcriptional regulator [Vibrio mediterranei]
MNSSTVGLKRYQEIGNSLKQDIFSGRYSIGDRYKSEREIAETYDVSRTVVREAFVMLEIEGVVEVKKGAGIYIQRASEINGNAIITSELADVGPFELLQARQYIESEIASLAALQVTKNDIIKLKKALESERQFLNNADLNQSDIEDDADEQFHRFIAEATQNSVLAQVAKDLWSRRHNSAMWAQLHSRIENKDYRKKWLDDHEVILAALVRRDASGAKEAMWQHLENVKQTLLELSNIDDPNFDGYLFG